MNRGQTAQGGEPRRFLKKEGWFQAKRKNIPKDSKTEYAAEIAA